jgi:hypothetical protein
MTKSGSKKKASKNSSTSKTSKQTANLNAS